MKNCVKPTILFFLLVLVSASLLAETYGEWEYLVKDNEAVITKYTGSDTKVVFPAMLNGLPVVEIRAYTATTITKQYKDEEGKLVSEFEYSTKNVFYGNNTKRQIVLQEGIKRIGTRAFQFVQLENINLPSTLISIDREAFVGCKLTQITLPENLEWIATNAFQNNHPKSIKIGKQVKLCYSSSEFASGYSSGNSFSDYFDAAYNANAQAAGIYTFLNGVWYFQKNATDEKTAIDLIISEFLFANNTIMGYTGKENTIEIPATINGNPVLSIGDRAFYRLPLVNVSIPNTVTKIGDRAFTDHHFSSIKIPPSVTSIGAFSFYNDANNLTEITIGANVEMFSNSFINYPRFLDFYEENNRYAGTYKLNREESEWVLTTE
ncbi:MAG: leucine-rich repeat domain-containing protein [Spirochaetaceae bacterium]|jgi:hypothetical protein|nr:leucine-rich repeat domain-containing protein [Spirochaetaceae bacterium]